MKKTVIFLFCLFAAVAAPFACVCFGGEYEFLDYIESTGAERIDTGIVSVPGLEAEADVTPPTDSASLQSCVFFGHTWSGAGYMFIITTENNTYYTRFHSSGTWADIPSGEVWLPGERIHFRGNNTGYEVNGFWTNLTAATSMDAQENVQLFRLNKGGNHCGVFKLHHFSLRNPDGTLACDYYPARRINDQALGLYDQVSGTFKTSSTGSFVPGGSTLPLSVVLLRSDIASATFQVFGFDDETPTNLTAVLSREGKTVERVFSLPAGGGSGGSRVVLDGLKPDTEYQVYFTMGETRFPEGSLTLSLRTLSETSFLSDYTLLAAVHSTGLQQLDTGIVSAPGLETEADITPPTSPNSLQSCVFFGHTWSGAGYLFMITTENNTYYTRFHSSGTWADIPSGEVWQPGERIHFRGNNTGYEVNGFWTNFTAATATDEQKTVQLFRINDHHVGAFSLHHLSMKDSDAILLRDYYPAKRDDDGVVGLYDRVSGQFFPPDVGALLAGDELPEQVWLAAGNLSRSDSSLRATLTRSGSRAADIYAVWGVNYAGKIATDWESSQKVGSFAADATSASVKVSPIDRTARYVRFYTSDGFWSETVYLPDLKVSRGLSIILN